MLELHEERSDDRIATTYWVAGQRASISFQVAQLPPGMFLSMDEEYERMGRDLGTPLPPSPLQRSEEATWMAIDLVAHYPDAEGEPCPIVEGGKCSLWGGGLNAGELMQKWLAGDRDQERMQVLLNEIYEERFG